MKLTKIKEKKNQHDLEIIGQYRNWWLFSVVERKKDFKGFEYSFPFNEFHSNDIIFWGLSEDG